MQLWPLGSGFSRRSPCSFIGAQGASPAGWLGAGCSSWEVSGSAGFQALRSSNPGSASLGRVNPRHWLKHVLYCVCVGFKPLYFRGLLAGGHARCRCRLYREERDFGESMPGLDCISFKPRSASCDILRKVPSAIKQPWTLARPRDACVRAKLRNKLRCSRALGTSTGTRPLGLALTCSWPLHEGSKRTSKAYVEARATHKALATAQETAHLPWHETGYRCPAQLSSLGSRRNRLAWARPCRLSDWA